MYAMVCTCPDIAHAISAVTRFMSRPSKEHWKVVQQMPRSLRGTSNYGLMFDQRETKMGQVLGYSHFDHAGDQDERHYITCNVFQLCGYSASWSSTFKHVVAL